MSTDQALADYYAQRANEYEGIYAKPERQSDLRILRDLVGEFVAREHVLEIACGTGYWTQVMSRTAGSVMATDINTEVLDVARSKGLDNRVRFLQADAYSLPVTSGKFTAGFSGFWWSHIPRARLADFLRGFHQRLSPGAKVLFIDNRFVEGSSTPISRTDAEGNTYQTRRLASGATYEVLKNFPDESELRCAVMEAATGVQIRCSRYYWALSYVLGQS